MKQLSIFKILLKKEMQNGIEQLPTETIKSMQQTVD